VDVDVMRASPIGRLVPITGYDPRYGEEFSHYAYVPDPLPDEIALSAATYSNVIDATAAVARADQASALLPNPALLARPATRREAVSTSALEGTYAALSDVFEADFLDKNQLSASVNEVNNYVHAAEQAYAWVADGRPITIGMIENLHRVLVAGTPSDGPEAGHIRTTQVFIGAGRGRVPTARFVPPPPDHLLRDGLLAWQDWIRQNSALPSLVRIAAAHYQFETLHPFNDGNGRLGRLVAVLQLMVHGDLRHPILNISPWLERNRSEYQDGLLEVSATGSWDKWVQFFCAAIHSEALEVIARVDRLLALRTEFRRELDTARAKGVSLRIADDLIGYPMVTATLASDLYGVTYQAANTAIRRLVDLGILRQRTQGRYDRIFSSDAVLIALDH
jgi:Fic family protein